jgi:O-antigen/teichoic acid export membrane protein
MFSTLGQMSTSFFLSQGKAHLHLKLNVFTQSIKIAFLVIGVQWGGFGIMVAFAASTAVSFSSAIYLLSRFLTFNLFTFINAIKKTSIITLFMIASLFILNDLLIPFSQPVLLLFNSTVGAIIYVTLSVIIKNSSFLELTQLIFSKFFKR